MRLRDMGRTVADEIAFPAHRGDSAGGGIAALEAAARSATAKGLPPVERWDPAYCGDLDIRIAADATWFYMGTPIGRKPLVKLFSSVLRRDGDGRYYLVTPVEKIGITVDDAPFLAVEMAVEGEGRNQRIAFRTNADDVVSVDTEHRLRFVQEEGTEGLKPYVRVRGRLDALVARSVTYDLVALAVEEVTDEGRALGVWSAGQFFVIAPGQGSEARP
jgi:uncharacterized protein